MNGKADIGKWRRLKGMTQEELAKKAKVNQSYLSQLERYKKSPTLKVLLRICTALDICPHKIMKYDFYCEKDCISICPAD